MGFIWFWLVAIMLVAYVVLDGFDIGVGTLHLFLARTEQERQLTLRTIGPVWDGNEVWLIAGGGILFAFPLLYASAFSGFYLALMIVLWLLILRGVAVELRMQIAMGVWKSFFDGLFVFSSTLLFAIFYGAALANVIRGVPLQADGYFFLPLWTNFRTGPEPGILDWYTVIGGVIALVALGVHGALYIAVKTEGDLQSRARKAAGSLWIALLLLTVVSLAATVIARPDTLTNYLK